jgi:hypothetical protein
MASTIKLKNGSGAPTTGDLVQGEPALDLTNKRLYTENASGVVIEVGTNPSTIDINAGTIDGTVIGGTTPAAVTTSSLVATTADINAGTIDGTVIGGSTAAAGTFTTGQFNTSLNVDGTVTADGLTVEGTTNDGTTLAQITQSGTGRAFSVNRNVVSATRAVVNIAQLQASGGAEAVLDIQQTTPASRAIKVTPDGSIDRFSVYGTGALVTTPVAGGHAVFNEGGADADFRVESATTANALFVEGSSGNVGIGTSSPTTALDVVGTVTADGLTVSGAQNSKVAYFDDTSEGGYRQLQFTSSNNGQFWDINSQGTSGGLGGVLTLSTRSIDRMEINTGGDISFYEDTGTTAKFFWDASAESLGIGTVSPATPLHINSASVGNLNLLTLSQLGNTSGHSTGLMFKFNSGGVNGGNITASKDAVAGSTLAFSTGAAANGADTERMRITSAGNVGIGTSSPRAVTNYSVLGINGTSGSAIDFEIGEALKTTMTQSVGQFEINVVPALPMVFKTSNIERARIDSSGNVGIGTSSPTSYASNCLHLNSASSSISLRLTNSTTGSTVSDGSDIEVDGSNLNIVNRESGNIALYTSATERVRIDSSGNLLVGKSSQVSAGRFGVQYDSGQHGIGIDQDFSGSGTLINFLVQNSAVGAIQTNGTTTNYVTSSDERLKENITDANDAGDKIDAIKVRQYDWKVDGSHQDYGMVAQELMTVAPEAVSVPEDPEKMMGVDYSKLVPMMLKEIQSLRARVAQLEGAN